MGTAIILVLLLGAVGMIIRSMIKDKKAGKSLQCGGALKRGTAYQLCDHKNRVCQCCLVELEDSSTVKLDSNSVEKIIKSGMQNSGLCDGKKVVGITWMQADDHL